MSRVFLKNLINEIKKATSEGLFAIPKTGKSQILRVSDLIEQHFRGRVHNCAIDDIMSVSEESMLAYLTSGEC